MARCPACGVRDNVDIQPTGQKKFRSTNILSTGLAGAQVKVTAIQYPEYKLSFLCCGKYVLGYVDGTDFYSSDQVIYNE